MKTLDRFLYFLLVLVLLAGCAGAVYVMIDPEQARTLLDNFIYNVENQFVMKLAIVAVVLVILALALKVLFSRSRDGGRSRREPMQIIISADGNVRITADTVSEIIVHAAKKLPEVRDAKCALNQDEAGLNVVMTIFVTGEDSIPEIAENTTKTVRETMENICGIVPANIRILAEKAPVATANVPVVR